MEILLSTVLETTGVPVLGGPPIYKFINDLKRRDQWLRETGWFSYDAPPGCVQIFLVMHRRTSSDWNSSRLQDCSRGVYVQEGGNHIQRYSNNKSVY